MKSIIASAFLVFVPLAGCGGQPPAPVSGPATDGPAAAKAAVPDEIANSYIEHAALAQLHRWYQFYEEPKYGIDNQLDILDPGIVVTSLTGTARGHDEYRARAAAIPATWSNAHFLRDSAVSVEPDGTYRLTATIEYLNLGILPDGAARRATIGYEMRLAPVRARGLPRFTEIRLEQRDHGPAPEFRSAYAENRLRSLVHYWLAIVEDPSRDPAPAREVLADGFRLGFSSGPITDFAGFEAWLAGPGSSVVASRHEIAEFAHERLEDGRYELRATFAWRGVRPDGTRLKAKTRHVWTVVNDPSERFARIRDMQVEVLEPFAPEP